MRVRPAEPLEPIAEAVLRTARLELGAEPEVLRRLTPAPESLAAVWRLLEETLLKGGIPRTTKELAALAAVSAAGVAPLRDLLRRSLAGRGVDDAVLDDLVAHGETQRLPDRTQAVLELGRRAVLEPAALADADFKRARRHGLDDPQLAELLAFAGAVSLLIVVSRALDLG